MDDVSGLSFSIRGGSGTGTITKDGFYGTLTLDASTGAWSFNPSNVTAINALAAGKSATESFEFKAIDAHGAATTQNLVITFTGTNDVPLLASAIVDQSFSGGGSWSYQIPAASFTDAEGIGLTYTVELVTDTSGSTLRDLDGDGGNDPGSLPSWLSFDAGTRTFSGNPPASWGDAPLFLKVTASDGAASVSDTFRVSV